MYRKKRFWPYCGCNVPHMSALHIEDVSHLPFEDIWVHFSTTPDVVYLDSGEGTEGFSAIGVFPTWVELGNPAPFEMLRSRLGAMPKRWHADIPFLGGIVGFLSYEAARHLLDFAWMRGTRGAAESGFGEYQNVIVRNLKNGKIWYVTDPSGPRFQDVWDRASAMPPTQPYETALLRNDWTATEFQEAVRRAKTYVADGHIYQVNLSHRSSAQFMGSPSTLYTRFRKEAKGNMGAYLGFSNQQILSGSPERLVRINGDQIITQPIKGTLARAHTDEEDERLRTELFNSEKNQAELLMIVDLARNDLARVCIPGSVHVDPLVKIRTLPHLHHLESTVKGQLTPNTPHLDALIALFPAGSITGAPKIRATEIIQELEPRCREVYTGSIGYFGCNGVTDFNVAIRTMTIHDGQVVFHSGGGIVADSDPHLEWEETQTKRLSILKSLRLNLKNRSLG